MRVINSIWHFMRSDFFERTRTYGFILVIATTIFAGYMLVPPLNASYNSFVIGGNRGIYNSPWVGTIFGTVISMIVGLFGFYLIKNAVERDRSTRVGAIIATTPIGKLQYVIGKWFSNTTVLFVILGILTFIAPIMQLIRSEDANIDLIALILPIWAMSIPVLAVTSAIALLFEAVPFLRGTFGNVVFFFVWLFVLLGPVAMMFLEPESAKAINDFLGLSSSMVDIQQQMLAIGLDPHTGTSDIMVPTDGEEIVRFIWPGLEWTAKLIFERVAWLGVAALIATTSALPFDRFDPARQKVKKVKKQKRKKRSRKQRPTVEPELLPTLAETPIKLSRLDHQEAQGRLWGIATARIRLLLKGPNKLWFALSAGLVIATFTVPFDIFHEKIIIFVWIAPIILWSGLGNLEARYFTGQIVFTAPNPLFRQLTAEWLAGTLLGLLIASGAIFRWLMVGEFAHILALLIGAMFVPAFALALGVWSGNKRLFEMLYLFWWYIGLIDKIPLLDFIGNTEQAISDQIPWFYLGLTILFLALALIGRKRQLA
jgi:hypothetical protein